VVEDDAAVDDVVAVDGAVAVVGSVSVDNDAVVVVALDVADAGVDDDAPFAVAVAAGGVEHVVVACHQDAAVVDASPASDDAVVVVAVAAVQ